MDEASFLALVRERLRGVEIPPLPDELPPTPASGDGSPFERFAEELRKVGGEARRIASGDLASTMAELAEDVRTVVVADGVGPYRDAIADGLARSGCSVLEPTREDAASAGLGVTGAVLGVASTGSILIPMGPDAPRVASLLPPVHVVVLDEARLVPGFEELFAAMPDVTRGRAQTVLITGPSRTADIELSIVRGVHGPGKLWVLVVPP